MGDSIDRWEFILLLPAAVSGVRQVYIKFMLTWSPLSDHKKCTHIVSRYLSQITCWTTFSSWSDSRQWWLRKTSAPMECIPYGQKMVNLSKVHALQIIVMSYGSNVDTMNACLLSQTRDLDRFRLASVSCFKANLVALAAPTIAQNMTSVERGGSDISNCRQPTSCNAKIFY